MALWTELKEKKLLPKGILGDFLNPKSSSGYVMSRQSVYVSSGPSSLRGRTRNRKSRRHGRQLKVKAQLGMVGRAAQKYSKFLAITQ